MKRKIVQNGPLTVGVSLPSRWVKKHGIKKGDDVDVEEFEGSLLIGSKQNPLSETKIHIPTKEFPLDKDKRPDRYSVRTIVINALRKGYSKVRITFDSPKTLSIINSCVDEVLGYEISEQGSHECIIENVVQLKDSENKYFSKFINVTNNFTHLIRENILDDAENFEEISSSFIMVEKNYNTFCRFLMNDLSEHIKEKIFLFTSVDHMYQSTRNMFYASKLHTQDKIKLTAVSLKHSKLLFDYVNKVMGFVASKDTSKIAELNILKNKLTYHDINNIICKKSNENKIILQLTFAARRMWDVVGPYTGSII